MSAMFPWLPPSLQFVGLLVLSNIFMTFAWYAHLRNLADKPWWIAALLSWGIALAEYVFQVPANRIGYKSLGGPFSLVELKVIQEVITLLVFVTFSLLFFKTEAIRWNHLAGFACLVMAVYFIFRY